MRERYAIITTYVCSTSSFTLYIQYLGHGHLYNAEQRKNGKDLSWRERAPSLSERHESDEADDDGGDKEDGLDGGISKREAVSGTKRFEATRHYQSIIYTNLHKNHMQNV